MPCGCRVVPGMSYTSPDAIEHCSLHASAEALRDALRQALFALKEYAEYHGPCCSEDCPSDDTCTCAGKTTNDLVGAASVYGVSCDAPLIISSDPQASLL